VEDVIGAPLLPYVVTKYVNEPYADVFARCYGFNTIGLRYFNVFGRWQDPDGAYAAVIPKWTAVLLKGKTVYINGDGETSRDFCYVANTVQANILAATTQNSEAKNQIYNLAVGDRTTLNSLFKLLNDCMQDKGIPFSTGPTYSESRAGDVRDSQADTQKVRRLLGYAPSHHLAEGIAGALTWYISNEQLHRSPLAPT